MSQPSTNWLHEAAKDKYVQLAKADPSYAESSHFPRMPPKHVYLLGQLLQCKDMCKKTRQFTLLTMQLATVLFSSAVLCVFMLYKGKDPSTGGKKATGNIRLLMPKMAHPWTRLSLSLVQKKRADLTTKKHTSDYNAKHMEVIVPQK